MEASTLDEIAVKHGTDKSSVHHNYTKIYEKYFEPLRQRHLKILEIGYGAYDKLREGGHGARTWLEYFPCSNVVSIDLHKKIPLVNPRFKFYQCSQTDPVALLSILINEGQPDIVVDDGSHINSQVIKTFEILFPELEPGGYYCIEDCETSFSGSDWCGGTFDFNDFNHPSSVNFARWLINEVNAKYLHQFETKYQVEEIHFHQNLIVIKKK